MSVKSNRSTKNACRNRQAGKLWRTASEGRVPDRAAFYGKGSTQYHMRQYNHSTAIGTASLPRRAGRRV